MRQNFNFLSGESQISVVLSNDQLKELVANVIEQVRGEDDMRRQQERNNLITREKACEMLGKDRTTLWRWAKDGYLKAVKVGRSVCFRLGDVMDILEGKR